jgi:hypothetical protein
VGICAYPAFLQQQKNINTFLDHIDYVAKTFGVDHVAIGTDRGSTLSEYVWTENMPRYRKNWEQYWRAPGAGDNEPDNFASLAWTNWPLFTVGLVMRGYSDSDIQKIIADKTSDNGQERILRCTFNLKSLKYTYTESYYLVIPDENGLQIQREEFQIDIAFAVDEFDFFS